MTLTSVISLGTLARSLNCLVASLIPLAEHGWLKLTTPPPTPITSQSFVEVVPEAAVVWLKSWLQPAQAKPLWSARDLAALIDCTPRDIEKAAAATGIPVVFEPALGGLVFSCWAARQVVQQVVTGRADRPQAARFDRAAMLWMILQEDPDRVLEPPPVSYSTALDTEIERVATLPEPERGLRAASLVQQFEDARRVVEASRSSAQPGAQSSAHDASISGPGSGRFSLQFEQLRRVV